VVIVFILDLTWIAVIKSAVFQKHDAQPVKGYRMKVLMSISLSDEKRRLQPLPGGQSRHLKVQIPQPGNQFRLLLFSQG
jgi:hypothetical protein